MASIAVLPAALQALERRIVAGSGAALKAWVDEVGQAANAEGSVPVDTGALQASQFIEGPLVGAGRAAVRIGYDTPYALQVHESPQSARKTGRSKWLETTITSKANDLGAHLKRELGL